MSEKRQSVGHRVQARAEGRCEAMVLPQRHHHYIRCPSWGHDVHHMLPRSRGGVILDRYGEIYHLVFLCRIHHEAAHGDRHEANVGQLFIDGSVLTGPDGKPHYVGTDAVLLERYGHGHVLVEEAARGGSADHATPRPLAGPARRRPLPSRDRSLGGRAADEAAARPVGHLLGFGHR
jgi:hypothetical protein